MDSSGSSLSGSWDIVSPTSITKKTIEESPNERPPNAKKNDRIRVDDKKFPTVRSGVDDINDAVISNQNDSNTSSDIDVIEEPDEDIFQMSFPTMMHWINSSKSAGTSASSLPPPAPVPAEVEWTLLFQLLQRLLTNSLQRLWENSQIKNYHVIVFVSLILVPALFFHGSPSNEMKDQVEILKKENDHLKNLAISSKKESEKLFLILDEQIKAMRLENQKLSKSMQLLLTKRMEEQSKAHVPEMCGASPNCFSNFFWCFSQTFIPRWW